MEGPRQPIAIGNFKDREPDLTAALELVFNLSQQAKSRKGVEIAVCPSAPHIWRIVQLLQQYHSAIKVGMQGFDLVDREKAHTNVIPFKANASAGATLAVVGHSENRESENGKGDGDSDTVVNRKLVEVVEASEEVAPVLCVGEDLDVRKAGRTLDYLADQIKADLQGVNPAKWRKKGGIIGYEPRWAIGKEAATAKDAQAAHAAIRTNLANTLGPDTAQGTRIVYGGSVKKTNARELIQQPDIDGFLVGKDSLDADAFMGIIDEVRHWMQEAGHR